VVRIQRCYLAAVVACLVRVLVVHVVWNADLGENARMNSRVLCTLVSNCLELMREAVSDGILSDLDRKRWCQILPSQNTKYVDVPYTVPVCC
jgi:hypothetical protein